MESLILLGRWPEARDLSARALAWLPVGVVFLMTIVQLAVVEIETEAGERAARLLGQTVLEFDALREPQLAGPYYLAAASYALWRGDVVDAGLSVERGWAVVKATEEWVLAARMAAMVTQVDAATGAEARERRQLAPLAAARSRTAEVLQTAVELVEASGAPPTTGSRRVAEAYLATARGFQRRLEGDDDPAVWARVATMWQALSAPYEVALARWRQAGGEPPRRWPRRSADAREPLLEAARLALALGAKPLLRNLRELAGRARIDLPDDVDRVLSDPAPTTPGTGTASAPTPPRRPWQWHADGNGWPVRSALVRTIAGDPIPGGPRPDTFGLSGRGARGARPRRAGPDEPGDRGAPVHQPEDGRRPRREHPVQAGGLGPGGGGRRRDPVGLDRPARGCRGAPGSVDTKRPGGRVSGSPGSPITASGWAPGVEAK